MIPGSEWARAMTVHHILSPTDRLMVARARPAVAMSAADVYLAAMLVGEYRSRRSR